MGSNTMTFAHIHTNEDATAAVQTLDEYVFTEPRKHLTLAWVLAEHLAGQQFQPELRFFVFLQIAHSATLLGEIHVVRQLLYQDLPRFISTTALHKQQELYDAWIDTYRASFLIITGDYREVETILHTALKVFHAAQELRGIAITEANLAVIASIHHDYDKSLQHFAQVRESFTDLPHGVAVGSRVMTMIFEVSVLIQAGRAGAAENVLREAEALAREHELTMPHVSAAFAQLTMANGDYDVAQYWFDETIARINGAELGENFTTLFYARYALFSLHTNQPVRARDLIDTVISDLPADGERHEPNATALRIASEIYVELGDWKQAFEHYQRFIKLDLRQRKSNLHHDYRLLTAAKELERLEFQANHDSLTKLLNRQGFFQATDSKRAGLAWGMLMIDTDHFKRVNDTHGHVNGDRVLQHVGWLIATTAPENTVVARIGGEEFAVFVPGTPEDLHAVANELLTAVRTESWNHIVPGLTMTISIGGAHASNGTENILTRADDELYKAKRAGRDRYSSER